MITTIARLITTVSRASCCSGVLLFLWLQCVGSTAYAITVTGIPATCASVTGIGTKAWATPTNAISSNNTYSTANVDGTITRWLQCTNYGFAIPVTATINGITVNVERKSSSTANGGSQDAAMRLVNAGVIGATDRSTTTIYTTADVTEAHGSATDLWGQTWTPADINATNFGTAFSATKPSSASTRHTISVDVISVTIDYTPDTTPPTVSSINRVNPSPTGAGSIQWTVTFSESVTGVDATDFSLVQAGGLSSTSISSVTGSGTTWTVTANTGSGSGTLGLNLVDNDSIVDLAANKLGGTGAGNGNFTGQVYTVDKNIPLVNSITKANTDPTAASSVAWTVVFSESVTGVDSGDFALVAGGVSGTSISSVSGSGTTWTVTASTGSGSGTLGLNVVDNDTIIDVSSNKLGGTGVGNGNFTGQVYTVDRTSPAVSTINRADPNPSNADRVRWTVIFNESVSGVDLTDFTLAASGLSGAYLETVTGSGTTWTVTANTGICSSACTLGLNLVDDDTIVDVTANKLGGTGTGNGNFTGQIYSVASTPPLDLWSMDESSWTGAADQVTDSGPGAAPGTSYNNATTTTGTGSCRFGVFDNGGTITAGGVVLPDFDDLNTDFTITAWIRTTDNTVSGQRIFIDDESNTGGYGLSLGDGGAGLLRFYSRGSSVIILDSANVINNNTWYFVAGVADITNGLRKVYVFDATGALLSTNSVASTGWGTDAGDASIGAETTVSGEPTSSFHFRGNIDEVGIYNKVLTQQAIATLAQSRACATAGPDHLQIESSGSGVTCTPSTLTIRACSDAAPSCTPYTGGVTGTLTKTGTPTANWSGGTGFSIAAGSSTTTKDVQVTTAGSVVFGISTPNPVPAGTTTCNFGSPTCTFTSALAGFVVSTPNQISCSNQSLTVKAVKQSDSSLVCVPAFANISKAVTISQAYINPTTGTRVSVVGGTSIATGGTSVTLAFGATGIATPTFVYDDVGQIGITVAYAGSGGTETGLSMTGSATPIVAPSSFQFSGITAAPIIAGANFNATVTALNACSAPATTPNFGKESTAESVLLSFAKTAPTGVGASNGSFSGSVGAFGCGTCTPPSTLGSAIGNNLNWSEVGQGTLTATLTSGNYLGSGLTATGTSGTVGRFKPAYFNTAVTVPGCSIFTYSGQPFTATVTANKQGGGTTVNYSGAVGFGTANATTLSDANGGTGTWTNNVLATSDFVAGVGTKSTVIYTFASRQTAPTTIAIRATESIDVVTSSGHTEGTTIINSGRFRLANAYGSEKLPLSILSQAEYYNGTGWVVNTSDNCTVMPVPTLTPSPGTLATTTAYNSTLINGLANLRLAAPTGGTGYFDITVNVPAYLEYAWRSAVATDPTARATFGFSKGTDRLIYRREKY